MTSANSAAQQRPELEELRSTLQQITELNVDQDLVRSSALGDMNFANWRDEFQSIIDLCIRWSDLRWDFLTPRQVQTVQSRATNLLNALNQIKTFDLTVGGNLQNAREQLAYLVIEEHQNLLDAAAPLIGFISWESIDVNALRREMGSALTEAQDSAATSIREINAMHEDASKALAAMREVSIEAGVAHHAETFANTATRHESSARRWLKAAVVAGIVTIVAGIALVFTWDANGNINDAAVLQIVLIKAFVLSVGFYATVTSVRLYRSNAHLAVINRHREDALRTFRAFVEGAGGDAETKSKVLLEATHAAFGQVPTGLVTEGSGSGVIEVLDGVTGLVRRSQ